MICKRTYRNGKTVWSYIFDAPGSSAKNRHQITATGFPTKKAAGDAEAARRTEAIQQAALKRIQGIAEPPPATLKALLTRFFTEHGEKRLAAKTLERYQQDAAYLNPDLLAMPVADLTASHLSREWKRLLESGGRFRKTKEPRPLASKTVRNIAGVVSSAYQRRIEWGITAVNPVPHSRPPVVRRKEKAVLSPAQQELLIDAASSAWGLAAFLELDAATGARRGELLALRWSDVDLSSRIMAVERSLSQTKAGLEFKEPKNGKSNRISLPDSAVEALNRHRQEQEKFRAQFGPDYKTDLNLIFANPDGTPLRPDSVSSTVSALFRRLKLPKGASLHSLRHTHGSDLIAAGVSLADVSRRLGHSNVYVTATIYAHAIAGNDEEVARKWEEYQTKAGRGKTARA